MRLQRRLSPDQGTRRPRPPIWLCLIVPLAVLPAGCRRETKPAPAPAASQRGGQRSAASTARLVRCGWGSVIQGPGIDSPPWLIALIDLDVHQPLGGLAVLGAELYAEKERVTRIGGTPDIRLQEGPRTDSLGAADTEELQGGALPVGSHRLRVATRLEGELAKLQGRHPDRCRVVLTDDRGRNLVIEGKLEPPWEVH